jgi:hypothetical protein
MEKQKNVHIGKEGKNELLIIFFMSLFSVVVLSSKPNSLIGYRSEGKFTLSLSYHDVLGRYKSGSKRKWVKMVP